MRKHAGYLPILFVVAVSARTAHAHLCDNVWRQADKLVFKPEVTQLVVKDKASFKIHVQSNMDRGIAKNMRLVGKSEAFDVSVEPERDTRSSPESVMSTMSRSC